MSQWAPICIQITWARVNQSAIRGDGFSRPASGAGRPQAAGAGSTGWLAGWLADQYRASQVAQECRSCAPPPAGGVIKAPAEHHDAAEDAVQGRPRTPTGGPGQRVLVAGVVRVNLPAARPLFGGRFAVIVVIGPPAGESRRPLEIPLDGRRTKARVDLRRPLGGGGEIFAANYGFGVQNAPALASPPPPSSTQVSATAATMAAAILLERASRAGGSTGTNHHHHSQLDVVVFK